MPTSPVQPASGRASANRVTVRRLPSPAPPPGGERSPSEVAAQEPAGSEARGADWLPWALSIFGAACAAFVLVKGVLPARNENAQLMQRVAKLESAALSANTERASEEQARGQIEAHAQAQLEGDSAVRQRQAQRQKQLREAARSELTQTFVDQFQDGSVWLEERDGQLVIDLQDTLLFRGDRTEITWKGRQFLSALAEILKHQPAEQVFQIGAHTEPHASAKPARGATKEAGSGSGRVKTSWELSARRAANVARFLEERGGLSGHQLVAAGFSSHRPAVSQHAVSPHAVSQHAASPHSASPQDPATGNDAASQPSAKNRRIEIVLLAGKS
jgi:flagellar motor protein MotB